MGFEARFFFFDLWIEVVVFRKRNERFTFPTTAPGT
jgi:hypothetical protein